MYDGKPVCLFDNMIVVRFECAIQQAERAGNVRTRIDGKEWKMK
ncbi:hypothetical protein LR69_00121 [Geobacillus sp. BCO2]|nr:hypothetical protein LR69_00121 [Geobacillus sp. BCO2]